MSWLVRLIIILYYIILLLLLIIKINRIYYYPIEPFNSYLLCINIKNIKLLNINICLINNTK